MLQNVEELFFFYMEYLSYLKKGADYISPAELYFVLSHSMLFYFFFYPARFIIDYVLPPWKRGNFDRNRFSTSDEIDIWKRKGLEYYQTLAKIQHKISTQNKCCFVVKICGEWMTDVLVEHQFKSTA